MTGFRQGIRRRISRAWFAGMLAALAGCHTPAPRATPPDHAQVTEAHPSAVSYDWHGLLIVPFGSILQDIPVALHEVLLFRDQAHGSAAADEPECYAADAPPPLFAGRTPDAYLLCFKQDRLSRIQASVRLPPAEAPDVFAAACADWLMHAAPGANADAPGASACEGRDGAIRFSGRLEAEAESTLSITLDAAHDP